MSRRARQRQAAKLWQQPQREPAPIDWAALEADNQRRQQPQQQQPKGPQ